MKKLISFILILAVISAGGFNACAKEIKYGDVNADGDVNSADALMVLQESVGKITLGDEEFTTAELDLDGKVGSSDALLILQYSVGKTTVFPAQSDQTELKKTNENTPEEEKLTVMKNGVSDFVITTSENAPALTVEAAKYLQEIIVSQTGTELEITTVPDDDSADAVSHQILVGETYCAESISAYSHIENNEYAIYSSDNKVAIGGGSIIMLYEGVEKFVSDSKTGRKNIAIAKGLTFSRQTNNATKAEYTGDSFVQERDDNSTGGAQFVTKLYTEGLGRSPESDEYLEAMNLIKENGCNCDTLTQLVIKVFGSDEFKKLNLTVKETAFAIYRGILNRDPSLNEIEWFVEDYSPEYITDIAESLSMSVELNAMMNRIVRGGYGWDEVNFDTYTSGKTMTSDEVNKLLEDKNNTVVSLPQGTLVYCTDVIIVPEGKTLQTEGNPTCYLKMARLMRGTLDEDVEPRLDHEMIYIRSDGVLQNVWVDGNRTGMGKGSNYSAICGGDRTRIQYTKFSDTTGPSTIATVCGYSDVYIGHNLITCYTSGHSENWCDGITNQAKSVIEHNAIIDATDVGIVVFRQWQDGWIQNTIVRYNKIINAGNPTFAMLHTDAWYKEHEMDFTGCVFFENELWTSMKAQATLCLSASSVAWFTDSNLAKGTMFLNNYTPEGLSVMTSMGLVADGTTDVVMRGNRLKLYLGDWGSKFYGGHHITVFNNEAFTGDVQGPFENIAIHDGIHSYIAERQNEFWEEITLTPAEIYEAPVKVPDIYKQ